MAGFLALTLSGCLNLDLATTVSPQGAFTGTTVMTFDKASAQEFGITDLSAAQAQLGVPDITTEHVSVAWSQTDTSYVQTVTYTDATTAEIEQATSATTTQDGPAGTSMSTTSFGFPLEASVRGTQMVVSLTERATQASRDTSPPADSDPRVRDELAQMLFGDSAVDMDITMPGAIDSVEGVIPDAAQRKGSEIEVDLTSRTVRVSAPFAALVALQDTAAGQPGLVVRSQNPAVASAAASPTTTPTQAPAAPEASNTANPAALAMGAAGLVAVVAALLLILRRRKAGTDAAGDPPAGEPGSGA